jgi:hypothetical protein
VTDLLPGVGEALDDQFTNQDERTPQAPAASPAATTCRFCTATFEGPARWFQRGKHEKEKHHEEWMAAKAGVKTPKKRTAKAQPKPKNPTVRTQTARSTVVKKRISAAESLGSVLGVLAKIVGQVDVPVGRAIQFSAPAAGQALDELVAGTVVDRIAVQKFAGAANKWDKVSGVLSFPVLIAVVSRNPGLYDVLEDQIRDAALDVIASNIPTMEKKKDREKKAFDALTRLGQVDERYANAVDPLGLFIQDIFARPVQEQGGETV